jgi:hypothetical protein
LIREYIDFHAVAPRHEEIHGRLQNWARSLYSSPASKTAPGFHGYQSPPSVRREREAGIRVDQADARKIGKGVAMLPEKHRKAVQWSYVLRSSVLAGRKYLGVTAQELDRLVVDARDMLCNRGV